MKTYYATLSKNKNIRVEIATDLPDAEARQLCISKLFTGVNLLGLRCAVETGIVSEVILSPDFDGTIEGQALKFHSNNEDRPDFKHRIVI